jgi:hypothetical protein
MLRRTGENMTTSRIGWCRRSRCDGIVSGCHNLKDECARKKGNELYTAQKYDEAIAQYEQLVQAQSEQPAGNYMIAVSYLALYHPGSEHPKTRRTREGDRRFRANARAHAPSPDDREKTEKFT